MLVARNVTIKVVEQLNARTAGSRPKSPGSKQRFPGPSFVQFDASVGATEADKEDAQVASVDASAARCVAKLPSLLGPDSLP
jgi:hypothetical protein